MKPHVMIDLETVSTQSNATILTFAAMKFDPRGDAKDATSDRIFNSNQSFYRRIDPETCGDLGGHIDDSTVAWWAKQAEEVKEEAFHPDDRHDIKDVLVEFHRWYAGSEAAWSNGSIFDINIIEYYNKELHRGNPWKFWQIRDTRTVYGLTDAEMPDLGANAHHALMDCWKQVVGVQNVYRKLGI